MSSPPNNTAKEGSPQNAVNARELLHRHQEAPQSGAPAHALGDGEAEIRKRSAHALPEAARRGGRALRDARVDRLAVLGRRDAQAGQCPRGFARPSLGEEPARRLGHERAAQREDAADEGLEGQRDAPGRRRRGDAGRRVAQEVAAGDADDGDELRERRERAAAGGRGDLADVDDGEGEGEAFADAGDDAAGEERGQVWGGGFEGGAEAEDGAAEEHGLGAAVGVGDVAGDERGEGGGDEDGGDDDAVGGCGEVADCGGEGGHDRHWPD